MKKFPESQNFNQQSINLRKDDRNLHKPIITITKRNDKKKIIDKNERRQSSKIKQTSKIRSQTKVIFYVINRKASRICILIGIQKNFHRKLIEK